MLCMKKLEIEPLKIEGLEDSENRAVEDRIERLLQTWERTPYLPGQNVRGRGVDCVHFVTSIYDELIGTNFRHAKLPQDASLHDKKIAEATLRRFFKMYPCFEVKGTTIQPGDIVICGPVGANAGPGHGMIAGTKLLWHVDSRCVCKAGLAVMQQGTLAFKQIRRLKDRTVLLKECL